MGLDNSKVEKFNLSMFAQFHVLFSDYTCRHSIQINDLREVLDFCFKIVYNQSLLQSKSLLASDAGGAPSGTGQSRAVERHSNLLTCYRQVNKAGKNCQLAEGGAFGTDRS